MGFAGAVIVISGGGGMGLGGGLKLGHVLALGCAFVWSGYSVLSRRYGNVPTDVVIGYCLITAVITALLHLAFEPTVWPVSATQWIAVLIIGALPLGGAFYTWDYGVKHGDIMVLGALSYSAPPLSVLILIAGGHATFRWSIALACLLITAGALIAAKDMILRRAADAPDGEAAA